MVKKEEFFNDLDSAIKDAKEFNEKADLLYKKSRAYSILGKGYVMLYSLTKKKNFIENAIHYKGLAVRYVDASTEARQEATKHLINMSNKIKSHAYEEES